MTLGNNIQKIRKEADLSQEKMAEMFNVARQTISNWENSKSYPDLETLIKISDSFQISLDILLKEDITMVKTIDREVKSTRKYARALTAVAIAVVLLIGSFGVYSMVYFNTKSNLESHFTEQLKENGFYKNPEEYYSMDYADGIVYGIPNQSMPGLLEFSLKYQTAPLYCDVDMEGVKVQITWDGYNQFYASATLAGGNKIIGSTSDFAENDYRDMQKLGDELGLSKGAISEIIEKGNELYQDFYSK